MMQLLMGFWREIVVESRSWVGVRFGATSICTPVTTCLIFFCSRMAVPTQLVTCFSFAHQPRRCLTGSFSPTLALHSFHFWIWAVATRPLSWLQKGEQPRHFLLDLILTESQVKFRSLRSISGASRQNSVAVFSRTTEEAWDCSQVSRSPGIPNQFEKMLFPPYFFLLKSSLAIPKCQLCNAAFTDPRDPSSISWVGKSTLAAKRSCFVSYYHSKHSNEIHTAVSSF